ncbi:hypothetical protein D3C78_1703400 [compost metagenome]
MLFISGTLLQATRIMVLGYPVCGSSVLGRSLPERTRDRATVMEAETVTEMEIVPAAIVGLEPAVRIAAVVAVQLRLRAALW